MTSPSKIRYFLPMLALIFTLTGCELARDSSEVSDMSPMEALPPTLAPLGSEDAPVVSEATAVPTVLSVQATATPAALEPSDSAASPSELVAPTAQPPSIPPEPAAENSETEAAPESSAPVAEAPESSQSIVVDATTPEELPEGGPIAANPPVSDTGVIPAANPGGAYIVQAGDTLFGISQRYGTSIENIVAANGLTSDVVQIGQSLTIPGDNDTYVAPPSNDYYAAPFDAPVAPGGPGGFHIVGPRDTLFNIAMRYGASVEAIAGANNIVYPYIIHEGQNLIIPGYEGGYPTLPPMNGYAPEPNYPQQPPADGYYQQPGQGYYPQQPPTEGYYQQPGQGYYPQQPPVDGFYQPDQGYQQPPTDDYYQQPGQGYYPQQPPVDGYNQQPDQGYSQPGQDEGYYPAPGYGAPVMPGAAGTHTVAAGETLYSIARHYGVPADVIAAANGLANPNQLFVGQVLFLP
ncbi:MAG TPA: LysM peptidoglycan-binding domain-containing protein [Anaerolineae bacterium]|nr:LysM peptidoglycan-binding domain-containing protein [Anaerolineae bacterium]HXV99309.1 LysM peptidoglycan-binding domain-containing protein [Anaerolineae bacterium]